MIRCFFSLFILLALPGIFPSLSAQSVTLALPVQGVPTSATQIDIPIQLSGSASVGAIQLAFTYDASQLAYVGPILTGTLMAGQNMIFNGSTPGEVRAGFASGSSLSLNSGVLCIVRFNVLIPGPLSYLVWNRNTNTTFITLGNGAPISNLQTVAGVLFPQGVTTNAGTNNGDRVVCELDTAILSITGSNATQFQWYYSTDTTARNFLPVNSSTYPGPFSGAQSSQLILPSVISNQQTGIFYFCRLTSVQGTTLSRAQQLTVQISSILFNTSIIPSPSLPLCSGANAQFRLNTPVAVPQAQWQWYVDGFPAGNDSILNLQTPSSGQTISCELRGANCVYSIADLVISTVTAPLVFSMTGGGTTCSRGPRLAIGLSGSQLGARYVLLRNGVSTADTINGTGQVSAFPTQLASGTYKVQAISAGGCRLNFPDSVLINHYPLISKSVSPNTSIIIGGSVALFATGGASVQSYNWFPSTGLSASQGTSVVASPQQTTLYSVSIEDFFGCRDTLTVLVTVFTTPPQNVVFSVRCLLQGLYLGNGQMRPALFQLGLSSATDAVDSIEVGIWNPLILSAPLISQKILLRVSGLAQLELPPSYRGNSYYISIKNRNSLETWSSAPVLIQDSSVYDFSNSQSSAYSNGNNLPLRPVSGGRFALYSGDVNQDGAIDISDLSAVWAATFGSPAPAYVVTDLSGDGIPDVSDLSLVWSNTFNSMFYARP